MSALRAEASVFPSVRTARRTGFTAFQRRSRGGVKYRLNRAAEHGSDESALLVPHGTVLDEAYTLSTKPSSGRRRSPTIQAAAIAHLFSLARI